MTIDILADPAGAAMWSISQSRPSRRRSPSAIPSHRIAASTGTPFNPDQLYDPEVNVRLGALYIGSLFKKFAGEVPLAAGAYNANPRAMGRWCQQHAGHPTDEFVELIAFAQTREYAKRVTSLYAKYRFLYGPTPFEIPPGWTF